MRNTVRFAMMFALCGMLLVVGYTVLVAQDAPAGGTPGELRLATRRPLSPNRLSLPALEVREVLASSTRRGCWREWWG